MLYRIIQSRCQELIEELRGIEDVYLDFPATKKGAKRGKRIKYFKDRRDEYNNQEYWDSLINNKRKPLINKAVSGLYPPGSTIKTLVALSALENKMQEKFGEGGFTTEEYIQALNEGLGQHQGAAILGGTGVAASEFAFDVLGSKIGGGGAGLLFKNPAMQSIMKNTLGRYLVRGLTMGAEYRLGQVKEGLTEGFQSYLSQATTNMASGYSSPFSRNIDYDQIATEMKAGYKMGGLFGFKNLDFTILIKGVGISFITILLSGTFSFVCDIDEKILKQKRKIENLIIF